MNPVLGLLEADQSALSDDVVFLNARLERRPIEVDAEGCRQRGTRKALAARVSALGDEAGMPR